MRVRQHVPSFVDGVDPEKTYVFSPEELERLEFVRRWKDQQMFYRFAIHRHYYQSSGEDTHLMLAEFDHGKQWWVVAYLRGPDSLKILAKYPDWEPNSPW